VSELEPFKLDARATAYVRSRLDDLKGYAPSLVDVCTVLEGVMTSHAGSVTTLALRGTHLERLYRFDSGGLLPENLDLSRATKLEDGSTMMPVASLCDAQREGIVSLVQRDPGLVCLAVDPLPRMGDAGLQLWPTTFLVGDDVYQLFTSETSHDDVELALFAAPFWCDLQIISRAVPDVDANRNSTAAELRKCAGAAIELWCSAYDGEGFLRWRRN
jgi:hypothetical protein